MSSYKGLKVAELRQICIDKGLSVTGLRKADILQLLSDNDHVVENVLSHESDSDDETGSGMDASDAGDDVTAGGSRQATDQSDAVEQLKLQLQIAKLEFESLKLKSKLDCRSKTVAVSDDFVKHASRDVNALLPTMHNSVTDVIAYFTTFEKTLHLHGVDRNTWHLYLPGKLNAKAAKVYSQLSLEQSRDYALIKQEILNNLKLTSKSYFERFKTCKKFTDESHVLFLNRMTESHNYYVESKKLNAYETLRDDVIMQQFLSAIDSDTREFVELREPESAARAAQMADLFSESRSQKQDASKGLAKPKWSKTKVGTSGENPKSYDERSNNAEAGNSHEAGSKPGKPGECWGCGSSTHKLAQCPNNKKTQPPKTANQKAGNQTFKGKQGVAFAEDTSFGDPCYVIPAYVFNKELICYRDTGTRISLIKSKWVPKNAYTGEHTEISGVTGPRVKIPLAEVQLIAPTINCAMPTKLRVGVLDGIPVDLL